MKTFLAVRFLNELVNFTVFVMAVVGVCVWEYNAQLIGMLEVTTSVL